MAVLSRTIDTDKYDIQDFFSKADLSGDCWTWQGSHYRNGYGKIGLAGYRVHRISYELTKGEIPKGLVIDHLCRVRNCINPSHLEAVSPKDNVLRGESQHAQNKRKTSCKNGHELNTENTYSRKDRNTRECKTCRSEAVRKFQRKEIW